MSGTTDGVAGGFLSMVAWRAARIAIYRAMGLFKPGWRRALPLLRLVDRYADKATTNMPVYSDPRFQANIRAMELEIRRLRRGGGSPLFVLPHDFPPDSQEWARSELHQA